MKAWCSLMNWTLNCKIVFSRTCRRKAFWVAKQILQLGMGDAFDDWLIEKIQLLRKGTVIAAGIRRIEEVICID